MTFLLLSVVTASWAPLFDPDEGYYPASAAETLRSGSFWDVRFNNAPRWDKPILSYALIEASFLAFGTRVVAARLPSAVEGALLLVVVAIVVRRLATPRAAWLSALVVGTSLGVSIFARVAHPEIAIVLSITTTQLLTGLWLASPDRRVRRRIAVAVGASVGLGLLAKGPVATVLPALALATALPFVACRKDLRDGIADGCLATGVALAIAAPWYFAMTARHGAAFLQESLWQQNVGRYTTHAYRHDASLFSLILPATAALFPWCAFAPQAVWRLRDRQVDHVFILRVLMFWSAVTSLLFYSASTAKLASYTLVCVPPLSILIGLLLDEALDGTVFLRWSVIATAAVFALGAVLLLASPYVAARVVTNRQLLGGLRPATDDTGLFFARLTVAAGLALAVAAVALASARTTTRVVTWIAALGGVLPVIVLACAGPVLASIYPWERFGSIIAQDPAPVFLLGRRAPSLTFYSGQPIVVVADWPSLQRNLQSVRDGWLMLTGDQSRSLASGGIAQRSFTVVAIDGRMVLMRHAASAGARIDLGPSPPRQ